MKTDVKTVEFLLSHKQRDVDVIRSSHKLRRKEAEVRLIENQGNTPKIFSSFVWLLLVVYIQITLSLIQPTNIRLFAWISNKFTKDTFQQGQEIYSHSRLKPFTQIHPNSSLVQYHLRKKKMVFSKEKSSIFRYVECSRRFAELLEFPPNSLLWNAAGNDQALRLQCDACACSLRPHRR